MKLEKSCAREKVRYVWGKRIGNDQKGKNEDCRVKIDSKRKNRLNQTSAKDEDPDDVLSHPRPEEKR